MAFDSGKKRISSEIPERRVFCKNEHFDINNRGVERTYYGMKSHCYWNSMKAAIGRVNKDCSVCNTINRKRKLRYEFIQTTRVMEKVELELMEMGKPSLSQVLTITLGICGYWQLKIRVQNICQILPSNHAKIINQKNF